MDQTATAGNTGDRVRSDCRIELTLAEKGGVHINLQSKVASMYGASIRKLAGEVLEFFDIRHAEVNIDDSGALPHVLAARLEACVRKVSNTRKEYLLPPGAVPRHNSDPERFRISRLYIPGNQPAMMINAGLHRPDGIILDLEDSVAPDRKDESRILVRNALRNIDFYGAEKMVRINQLPLGLEDTAVVVPHGVDLILVPKCEEVWQIREVEKVIETSSDHSGQKSNILLMPIIESALGVENAFQLATSSPNIVAMAIGLEDLCADLGVMRTAEGKESLYARTRIVNACKAAGIQPIDSVFSDVADMEALKENVRISAALGFEGMGCIHPSQIRVIHQGFTPSPEQIGKAQEIIAAFEAARKEGLGVVSIGSKMIDAPVVARAERTLKRAEKAGLIK